MRNRYSQGCSIARALDLIGVRWTLLTIDELRRRGPRQFQDLELNLIGIAPNTLSARLKSLEACGIIASVLYENHPPRLKYFLTEKGKRLDVILDPLAHWGRTYA